MASHGVQKLWRATSRHLLVLTFALAALLVIFTPIQHFIALGRYQHYGISIFLFGAGYLAQSVWSRKRLKKWARIAYTATGLFFTSVGLVFFNNPWLDFRVAIQTEEHDRIRGVLIISYLALSVLLGLIWIKWILSENQPAKKGKDPRLTDGAINKID